MTNKFLNPQNQRSSQFCSQYIEFRSLRFSILLFKDYQSQFKEQNYNIKLRGGGCGTSQTTAGETQKKKSSTQTEAEALAKAQAQEQGQAKIKDPASQNQVQIQISFEEIVKLILLRSSPSYPKEKQFKNRVNQIFHKIPKVIDGYGNIQNEMLSLLICEQLGSHYQSELDQTQIVIDPQGFELEGLKYQYELMITPKKYKEKINTDQNMKDLQKLEYQFNSIQILIENIKNIEMQLKVSESFDFKDKTSFMIYQLKYCFEKLFWIFFNLDKDIVLKNIKDLYENVIVNSKSIHIYNQWITLISNLYRREVCRIDFIVFLLDKTLIIQCNYFDLIYLITNYKPVEEIMQDNNLKQQLKNRQLFREFNFESGILLLQHISNNYEQNIQQILNKNNINKRFEIINQIKNIKYLQFQIQEKDYFDNQIKILKEKLIKNFEKYGQSEAIYPLLEHIETEQLHSKDSQIVKLKNIYINIMIDSIRILVSCNSFYNQCKLVNNFDSKNLEKFQNQFKRFEENLGNQWVSMIKIISDKILGKNLLQEVNLAEQIKYLFLEEVKLEKQIQLDFLKEDRNCLVDALNYQRKANLAQSERKLQFSYLYEIINYLIDLLQLIQRLNHSKVLQVFNN